MNNNNEQWHKNLFLPNGMLSFQTEEEGGSEVHDIVNTDNMIRIVREVLGVKISVNQGNQEPNHSKDYPGQEEGGGKPEYRPTPWEFNQACEEIFEKSGNGS